MSPPVPRPWRPTPLLWGSAVAHAAGLAGFVLAPAAWPAILGALVFNHTLLVGSGLTPKSRTLGPNITRLPGTAPRVALTFDDGPDPDVTPRVLDLLDAAGARASFFCVGRRAAAHPQLVREIARRGHRVENHSLTHNHAFFFLWPHALRREVLDTQKLLADLTGREPELFRPPAGIRSPLLEPVLARHGLALASWTRRGYDTVTGDPDRVLSRLTRNLAARDILLLHDGHARRTPAGQPVVLEVVPRLCATLRDRGLTASALDTRPDDVETPRDGDQG